MNRWNKAWAVCRRSTDSPGTSCRGGEQTVMASSSQKIHQCLSKLQRTDMLTCFMWEGLGRPEGACGLIVKHGGGTC